MPLASVEEAIVLDEPLVRTIEGREVMTLRGATLPHLPPRRSSSGSSDAGWPTDATPSRRGARPQGATSSSRRSATRRLGFVVDKLVGQQDIVIKALGTSLKGVRGFAGATELGDQRVALVLDAAALIDEVLAPAASALRRRSKPRGSHG